MHDSQMVTFLVHVHVFEVLLKDFSNVSHWRSVVQKTRINEVKTNRALLDFARRAFVLSNKSVNFIRGKSLSANYNKNREYYARTDRFHISSRTFARYTPDLAWI